MQDGKIVVLQVIGGLSVGGAESRIMDILRRLDRSRFQYDFLLNEEPGFYEEEAKKLGCRIYRTVKYKVWNKARYQIELREFFAAHPEIDIVQGHSTNTAALYLPIAKRAGIPLTIAHARSAGTEPGWKGWLKRQTRKNLFQKADVCLACSSEAAASVFGKEHFERGEVKLLPNAVDVDQFAPTLQHVESGVQLRQKLSLQEAFVVGHVGRFHYAKNHAFLLEIFAELLKKRPEAVLLLVGEGELEDEVRRRAEEMGIREKLIFAGRQADPAPFYQAMDLLIFPSHYEGLPGTIVESQASGLPAVLSDAVTKDMAVTPLLRYLSLEESAEKWAQEGLELAEQYPREGRSADTECVRMLREKGFDVKSQVRSLEKMYAEWLHGAKQDQ